jgi:diguanylate cyclase
MTSLEVNRSFVAAMRENKDDAMIVRSTIALGRSLGLRVVAERGGDGRGVRRVAAARL